MNLSFLIVSLLFGTVKAGCTVSSTTCYIDTSNRILGKDNVAHGAAITRAYCAQLCANAKMTLAGVESGQECYCGTKLNTASPIPSKNCVTRCNGEMKDSNDTCGGNWAIETFPVNCSGTPEPAPPQQPELVNPCLDPKSGQADKPWCDHTLSIDKRVDDAVSRLTLAEKINLMQTGAGEIKSLSLPPYNWWSEASTGVATDRNTQTTKFAFPITTGMSFNRTMWKLTGEQIAREARAMMNVGNAESTFWAPVINLAREPRWGRNIETPGEDPYLSGEYANYFVRGFQEAPEDPYHLLASACCKHYVANSMDGTTEKDGEHHDRNHVDSIISIQDLLDSYMVPFQACVEKGRVSSLMCSYNAVNGKPSCANDWLLQTVARENWNFDGYITSDCDADADVFRSHHYTATPEEAVRDVLRAGTDVDCGGFVTANAQSALDKGMITEQDMDDRLKMQFRVRMRLSHFDPLGPLNNIPTSVICSDYALELSQSGVTQSAALLKNTDHRLPLAGGAASLLTVAVIGPTALLSKADSSYYGPSNVCGGNFWTLVDAVNMTGGENVKVVYSAGVPSVLSNDTSLIAAAVAVAQAADVVILSVGTDLSWAAEGHDAKSIAFTAAQSQLIAQVSAAAKTPVIVVTMTATPLDLTAVLGNVKVGAVLHIGQPSVTVLGVGPLLFGDVSPAGRTIQTIYPSNYQDMISIFDFNMRPGPSTFARPDCTNQNVSDCPLGTNPGRTYRFYTGNPVVQFGYGLSYTTFQYSQHDEYEGEEKKNKEKQLLIELEPLRDLIKKTKSDGHIFIKSQHSSDAFDAAEWHELLSTKFAVNVTNTGTMDADDVVLGFLTPPGSGKNGAVLKQLFGFERVHVKAGETKEVFLYPTMTDFATVQNGRQEALTGEWLVSFGIEEDGHPFFETTVTTV